MRGWLWEPLPDTADGDPDEIRPHDRQRQDIARSPLPALEREQRDAEQEDRRENEREIPEAAEKRGRLERAPARRRRPFFCGSVAFRAFGQGFFPGPALSFQLVLAFLREMLCHFVHLCSVFVLCFFIITFYHTNYKADPFGRIGLVDLYLIF